MQFYDLSEKACDCGKRGAASSDLTKRRLGGNLKGKQLKIALRIAVYGMSMRMISAAPAGAMGGSISKSARARKCRIVTALELQ
jgi:hypothetical protein